MGYKDKTQLNERDTLMDVLNLEKEIVKMYSTCLTEGDSKGFRQTVKNLFTESAQDQYEVFKLLKDNGYCQLEEADQNKMKQLKEQSEKKIASFK